MKRHSFLSLVLLFFFCIFNLFSSQDQDLDLEKEKHSIRLLLEAQDKSLKDKNLEEIAGMFALDKKVFSIGPGLEERAAGWEALETLLKSQSQIIRILDVLIKQLDITFDDPHRARYLRLFDLRFISEGLLFAVEDIRETGVLEKKENRWKIVQQHASAPVTDLTWPFYLSRSRSRYAEFSANRQFRPQDLKEDFDLLRLALEEAHPGLCRYTSKEEFDAFFLELFKGIDREMTEIEFFRLACPVFEKIHCVHTSISTSSDFKKYMEKNGRYFPLGLKFIENNVYVVKNFDSDSPVPLGSRILSINQRSMAELATFLKSMFPSDGKNESYKYRILDRDFSERYFLYIGQPDLFQVEYIPMDKNALVSKTLPGVTYQRVEQSGTSFESMYSEALKLDFFEESDTAVLTIKTFVPRILEYFGFEYEEFLKDSFQRIEENNIRNLVIDLRDNDGGEGAYSAQLLSHLVDVPVRTTKVIDTPRTRYSFLEYTDKGLFFNWFHPRLWTRGESGRYILKGNWRRSVEPAAPHFDGKVYILINGMSISATSGFAALAHQYNVATFIGEETGGAYYSDNGGDFLLLTLPHTKLRINIPIRSYVLDVSGYPHRDRGVIPDYEVLPEIEDILQNRDTVLEFTLNLIREKRDSPLFLRW